MTSRAEIAEWFDKGVADGARNMVVVCDQFDHEDYPVYVGHDEDPHKVVSDYNAKSMQRVMEVYCLDPKLREKQLTPGTITINYDAPQIEPRIADLVKKAFSTDTQLYPVGLRDSVAQFLREDLNDAVTGSYNWDVYAQEILAMVQRWLMSSHQDGRPLHEQHGWATRYAAYLLAGGEKQPLGRTDWSDSAGI